MQRRPIIPASGEPSKPRLAAVLLAGVVAAASLAVVAAPPSARSSWLSLAMGVQVSEATVAAQDGTPLATVVLRPWWRAGRLPTILIRTPYGRMDTGRSYARRGFAVVVQDMRGRYGSGGVFQPYTHEMDDGVATLDWIAAQPWSNGRVATVGCSALGESQLVLARARHPAHAAMIAEGAGGGVGSAAGRHAYFSVYENGIFELASAAGWFARQGGKTPTATTRPTLEQLDRELHTLPVRGMVARLRSDPTDFDLFRTTPPGDAAWARMGYLTDTDRFATPGLHVNGWYDQGVVETLRIADVMARNAVTEAARHQHVIIGPGTHCQDPGPASGRVGDIDFEHADEAFADTYERWLRGWLDAEGAPPRLPRFQVFVLRENAWLRSDRWPPAGVQNRRWHLDSGGNANSRGGDGRLADEAPAGAVRSDRFISDPMRPVPTRGGAFCCTVDAVAREGPRDQADIDGRADVLVYTSAPLAADLRIAGAARARLVVSSTAADTDFIVKLVDVQPDGRAIAIQSGALRLRYREGVTRPKLAVPNERIGVDIEIKDIAYLLRAGHRLRLQMAGSDFPRLERNLQTGGSNFDEVAGVRAENSVHHGAGAASFLDVPVLPGALNAEDR